MKRILIVEDNPTNLALAVQLLEGTYSVLTAADGLEGIAVANREKPDLILMDLSLPRLDGWEATARLKGSPLTERIPIVALTAHAGTATREESLVSGFDGFLSKPIDEDVFFSTVRGILGE